ncbi:hypothetical protein ACLKA6_001358 [Drosophila palustris]
MEAVQPEAVPAESVVNTIDGMAVPENAAKLAVQIETTPQAIGVDENTKAANVTGEAETEDVVVAVESGKIPESDEQLASKAQATSEVTVESLASEPMCTEPQVESDASTTDPPVEMECETTNLAAPNKEEAAPSAASTIEAPATTNSLSLLAAYSSDADSDTQGAADAEDSDNDDVVEVPVSNTLIKNNTGRRQVVAVSSGSDSSSESDSDSEGEYLTVLRQKIDKRINTEECDEDDDDLDDDAKPRRRQPPKVRGEMLLDELPPIDQLEITVPEDECIELGKVQSIVDQLVLVSVLPNSMLFDLDTVLFLEKGRKVLGQVFDVLGQVADPLYCVRFNSNQQIKDRGINIGDIVYCAPQTEHTQFVILSKLMQVRGSDASWEHDVEPPAKFIDYSDDEAEREARWEQRKKRQRERTNSTDSVDTVSTVATEASEAVSVAAAPSRQRGRRAQRDNRQSSNNYQNGNQQQQQNHTQSRSQTRDTEYNYHPSYNPGSWHSNYYHNFHPPAANFNMMPGMAFPMPAHGFGYGMPPPHPYAMPPHMGMPPPGPPPHMYPPHPHPPYGSHPPPSQAQHPPNSGD